MDFLILCFLCFLFINTSNSFNNSNYNKYNLKWISSTSEFPINFTHKTNGEFHRWFKYIDNVWVDKLPKYMYKSELTEVAHTLSIFGFDNYNYQQLDHYESRMLKKQDEDVLDHTNEDILLNYDDENYLVFTLGALKSHEMPIIKTDKIIKVSCVVTLVMPNGETIEQNRYFQNQLQNSVNLDLKVPSDKINDNEVNELQPDLNANERKRRSVVRKKRALNEDRYLIEIELTDGPLILYKTNHDDELEENVTCSLVLTNFDGSIAYNNVITKIVQQDENGTCNLEINLILIFIISLIKFI